MPAPDSLPVLEEVYRLGKPLGEGGFGVVLRAEPVGGGEPVAVKLARDEVAASQYRRIRREARLAAGLEHPNLVRFLGLLRSRRGGLALVYELLPGEDLTGLLDAPLGTERALELLRGMAAGLDALHRSGLVHRDLKPGNLRVLPDGTVKLLDFGLLRSTESGASVTAAGVLLGTPAFMAPELLMGEPATPASDHYALACLAFRMLTGALLQPESPEGVLRFQRDPGNLERALTARLPGTALREAFRRCLGPPPRASSSRSLVEALARASESPGEGRALEETRVVSPPAEDRAGTLDRTPIPPREEPRARRTARPRREDTVPRKSASRGRRGRRRLLLATGALALVLLAGGLGAWMGTAEEPREPPGASPGGEALPPSPTESGDRKSSWARRLREELWEWEANLRPSDPDPREVLDWPEVRGQVRALDAFYLLQGDPGLVQDRTAEERRELERIGEWSRRIGLPDPGEPLVGLRPRPSPGVLPPGPDGGEHPLAALALPIPRDVLRGPSWAGTLREELAQAYFHHSLRKREIEALGPEEVPPGFQRGGVLDELWRGSSYGYFLSIAMQDPLRRRFLVGYLGPVVRPTRRALLAAGMVLREEAAYRDPLAEVLVRRVLSDLSAYLPFALGLPGVPGGLGGEPLTDVGRLFTGAAAAFLRFKQEEGGGARSRKVEEEYLRPFLSPRPVTGRERWFYRLAQEVAVLSLVDRIEEQPTPESRRPLVQELVARISRTLDGLPGEGANWEEDWLWHRGIAGLSHLIGIRRLELGPEELPVIRRLLDFLVPPGPERLEDRGAEEMRRDLTRITLEVERLLAEQEAARARH